MRNPSARALVALLAVVAAAAGCRGKLDRSTADFVLTPVVDAEYGAGVGLRGSIVIGATFSGGRPLANATIALVAAGSDTLRTQSDVQGRFTFATIAPGTYDMEVVVPRDTNSVRRRVTMGIQPVRLVVPSGAGRVDVQLLARYLPGSTRLIAAVDLITADR